MHRLGVQQMNLIDFLTNWCVSLQAWLPEQGISIRFGATSDDRAKASAWVTLSRGDRECELLLWDSGEAEYASGGSSVDLVQRHHDMSSVSDLARVLGEMLEGLND